MSGDEKKMGTELDEGALAQAAGGKATVGDYDRHYAVCGHCGHQIIGVNRPKGSTYRGVCPKCGELMSSTVQAFHYEH